MRRSRFIVGVCLILGALLCTDESGATTEAAALAVLGLIMVILSRRPQVG